MASEASADDPTTEHVSKKQKLSEETGEGGTAPVLIAEATGAVAEEAGGGVDPETVEPALRVIDWTAALEQCVNDESFLKELLGDLKDEVTDHTGRIVDELERLSDDWPKIVRDSAHAMKGATANLMCEELNKATKDLEAHAKKSDAGNEEHIQEVRKLAAVLKIALQHFVDYMTKIEI